MDILLTYVSTYGLPILLIAVGIILFIGLLKVCKLFDKIKSKDVKKFIYYTLDVVLAFAGAAIYFAICKLDWSVYITFSVAQLGVTTTLYAFYEHYGLRKVVQVLLNCVASWFKKNPNHKLTKLAKSLGWDAAIAEIQKAKIEEQNTNK